MKKMTEGKKAKPDSDIPRPQDDSVGALLRATRLAKNLDIEEVSAALRIRHIQLRAIEENNLEELPGITYAVGFVRSYAHYLGLNGAEVADRFKAEQGYAPAQSKLSFPEPVSEGSMPDPLMVGVGFFLAVLVLVFWTVYSNVSGGSGEDAGQIPPPPAAETMTEASPEPLPGPVLPEKADTASVQPAAAEIPDETKVPVEDAPKKNSSIMWNKTPDQEPEAVIKIKRGTSRVALQASEASWVQITDAGGAVIYKKVLKPGEQYNVPDQTGLSLVTGNAGGLDISVDDKPVQPLGELGEIVRGISLDPDELKKQRHKAQE
jgi:cytoskeleton protein RodZ